VIALTFANPLPWWALLLAGIGCVIVAWHAYRRSPVAARNRFVLSTIRGAALAWIVLCLMRPVAGAPPAGADAILPIAVDVSRSMGLAGADGHPRIEDARRIASELLQRAAAPNLRRDLLAFGERVTAVDAAHLDATATRTNIADALKAIHERYRGQPVAGILLITDGADNGGGDIEAAAEQGPPVFVLGVGPRAPLRDREVLSVTAADAVLDGASVDVSATAVAHGYGTAPIELRLLENGKAVDVRSVTPSADGAPIAATFTVAPARDSAVVYTVEAAPASDELVLENNERSALVPAARPPLRVLLVQGAPGFEHAFLRRAWTTDPAIQVDSVVRKGKDDRGVSTFYVQAAAGRGASLLGGFPATREALFAYDAIVLANVDADDLTTAQMDLTHAFVAQRGGGLLVLGARGFQRQGFRGTALETVLPLDLSNRADGVVPVSNTPTAMNRATLTAAGESHPVMQIGASPEDTVKRWAAIPPLAAISPLGAPRPGSTVLAVTAGPGGVPRALVAVQRVGDGRVMIFTGEASWRWRMMLPAADHSYDRFWRQAVRWLGQNAPSPVHLTAPAASTPGAVSVEVTARDASFAPYPDAQVDVRLAAPDGRVAAAHAEPADAAAGRYRATLSAAARGTYRVTAEVRRGANVLGAAAGVLLVGGVDPEFTDPRMDTGTLSRIARASGGAVVSARDLPSILERLRARGRAAGEMQREDLWSKPWSFAVLASLLGGEWLLRRRWGLR
jgi:uncharacterized membrane protein